MRIRFKSAWGTFAANAVADLNYTIAANLVYAGVAEEVKDSAVAVAASVDFPPHDKMVRPQQSRHKRNRKKRSGHDQDQDDQDLRQPEGRPGVQG